MQNWILALCEALNHARVRYLVVGGVAVVLHGYLRATADVDLVVQLDPANARRAMEVLERLGFRPRVPVRPVDFADASLREAWVRDKGMIVFGLWHPNEPLASVDVFVREPFPFDDVCGRSVPLDVRGVLIPVVSLPELLRMKRASGRYLDLADIETLRKLHPELDSDREAAT